jgi:hypothetical protein
VEDWDQNGTFGIFSVPAFAQGNLFTYFRKASATWAEWSLCSIWEETKSLRKSGKKTELKWKNNLCSKATTIKTMSFEKWIWMSAFLFIYLVFLLRIYWKALKSKISISEQLFHFSQFFVDIIEFFPQKVLIGRLGLLFFIVLTVSRFA